MLMFSMTSIIMVNAQTETNMTNMTNPILEKKEPSLSIGELIVESKTKSEGMKISDIDKQEFEASGQVMQHYKEKFLFGHLEQHILL